LPSIPIGLLVMLGPICLAIAILLTIEAILQFQSPRSAGPSRQRSRPFVAAIANREAIDPDHRNLGRDHAVKSWDESRLRRHDKAA
jgi:hypothetical protein